MASKNVSLSSIQGAISDGFELFKDSATGNISKGELLRALRYLGQFPIDESILLSKGFNGDTSDFGTFEKLILSMTMEKGFQPSDSVSILNAFRSLDRDDSGFLNLEIVKQLELDDVEGHCNSGKFSYESYAFNFVRFIS
jgi:Ca2+-binding EF-hand superfamily protein